RQKEKSGDNPVFYQYLGSTLENLDRPDEAYEVYEKAMASFPGEGYFPWRLSVLLKDRGNEAELPTARTLIEKAIEINPDNYNYRFAAGQLYKQLGEWEEARKQYVYLVERNESSAFYQNEYGVLLCEVGEFTEAIPVFKEAIRLNDAMPLYYQNMANAYVAMGDEEHAAETFEKASQLEMELSPAGRN
ncbi:MAG TPA: tetratricopeptide repeat protein, partial [Puia sp.]|nr:tetratricopeptide repeat protein [Puia sp.]